MDLLFVIGRPQGRAVSALPGNVDDPELDLRLRLAVIGAIGSGSRVAHCVQFLWNPTETSLNLRNVSFRHGRNHSIYRMIRVHNKG